MEVTAVARPPAIDPLVAAYCGLDCRFMTSVTCMFYAVVTLLLGIATTAVLPLGGLGDYTELGLVVARLVTIGGPVFFAGAALMGAKILGD
jgi:hypothetical protein